jgi:hypothetical protein
MLIVLNEFTFVTTNETNNFVSLSVVNRFEYKFSKFSTYESFFLSVAINSTNSYSTDGSVRQLKVSKIQSLNSTATVSDLSFSTLTLK